jgi:TM2 domain-containing membrane protein YozV
MNVVQADVPRVIAIEDSISFMEPEAGYAAGSPNPFFDKVLDQKPGKKNKKIAAALAFPVTGVTGIHRVYLGTAAYVPVVYVGTLGGCLGILPFIDFVAILIEKDITKFQGNRKIFMWVEPQRKPKEKAPTVN